MSAILNTPETWVTLSLILFFGILGYFGVHKWILSELDKRVEDIRAGIDTARNCREEASDKADKNEQILHEVKDRRDSILEQAREDAAAAKRAALEEFDETLARRVSAAEERIVQAERAAQQEIRNKAIDIAIAAVARVAAEHLSDSARDTLADRAIGEVRAQIRSEASGFAPH